jgi:hypothetical protein
MDEREIYSVAFVTEYYHVVDLISLWVDDRIQVCLEFPFTPLFKTNVSPQTLLNSCVFPTIIIATIMYE